MCIRDRRTEGQINARLSKSFLKETLTITFTANDILRTGYFHFDLYGIDADLFLGERVVDSEGLGALFAASAESHERNCHKEE